MKTIRSLLIVLLAALMLFGVALPACADELEGEVIYEALEESSAPEEDSEAEKSTEELASLDGGSEQAFVWQRPGSADVDILSGGTTLTDGDAFYYARNGIWCAVGGEERRLSEETGKNLNLSDGWLYYTTSDAVRRISLADGACETVYECSGIDQLYVIGRWLLYLADGSVYTYDRTAETLARLDTPEGVTGLIPTEHGNLYLTGDVFDRRVWVDGSVAFEGVLSCYTDSGYLVINRSGTYQIALETLFAGGRELAPYDLHSDELVMPSMTDEEAMAAEAVYFDSEEYAVLAALGEQDDGIAMMALDGSSSSGVYITAQQLALSSGDMNAYNITRRARQHAEVLWTPLKDVLAWGGGLYRSDRTVTSKDGVTTNYFKAGETYQGVPYSQAVYSGSHREETYVGCQLSLTEFVEYVNHSESKMYTGHSVYGQIAPYYGSDCAGFVSAAWALPIRCSCPTLLVYSSYIGTSLNQLQLGDCLNKSSSHVVLITDIAYDYYGNIVSVEITEQTPLCMKVTNYGEKIPGKTNEEIYYVSDLNAIYTYYLNNGYYIYRRSYSGDVTYTAESASPLDEDGWLSAPQMTMSASEDGTAILVSLSHIDGLGVYYTVDGSTATTASTRYTGPIAVSGETTIRAVADAGEAATGAFELVYTVTAEKADTPSLSCQSGAMDGTTVAAGSVVTLTSCEGAVIYYTTDGSVPTTASAQLGDDGITLTEDTTLRAIAVAQDRLRSDEARYDLAVGVFYEVKVSATGGGTICPDGTTRICEGQSQTFTFQAGENYKLRDVLVDGSSVGAVESYTLSDVRADHSVEVEFVVDLPFVDVPTTAWYAESVAYAYTNDLLKGITETAFGPNLNMTRGQFATLLGRYAGMGDIFENFKTGTVAYTDTFSINVRKSASTSSEVVEFLSDMDTFVKVTGSTEDASGALWYKVEVNGKTGYIKAVYEDETLLRLYDGGFQDIAGQYYNGYIQWAYHNELLNGMSATSFGSEYPITRQDICVVLYRYLTSYLGKNLSTGSKSFTDESAIRDYAKTAVHALAEIGVVNGYNDGSFQPREYATRAEVATMFTRLDAYLNG